MSDEEKEDIEYINAFRASYQHEQNMKRLNFIIEHKNDQNPTEETIQKMREYGLIYHRPYNIGSDYHVKGEFRDRVKHYHKGSIYRHITQFKTISGLYFQNYEDAAKIAKQYTLIWNKKENIQYRLNSDLRISGSRPTIKLIEVKPEKLTQNSNTWILRERYKVVKIPIKTLRAKRDIIEIGSKVYEV